MFSKQGGFWQSVVGSLCALHWSGCDVASPIDGPVQTPPDERASKDMTLSPPILTVPAPREPGGCAPGSFERVAATPAEPAECVPVSACRAGEVEVAPATATSDRICGTPVQAGAGHACRLDPVTHAIQCWGQNAFGESTPPPGEFRSVSVGDASSCGLRMDGSLECWGNGAVEGLPASTHFSSVSAPGGYNCAVLEGSQHAWCWGKSPFPDTAPEGVPFVEIAVAPISYAAYRACGIRADDNRALCWGSADETLDDPVAYLASPPDELSSISVGPGAVCGVRRADGSAVCWGENGTIEGVPEGVGFAFISVGLHLTCGIRAADGSVSCWGPAAALESWSPPAESFESLSVGESQVCGSRADGRVVCWGPGAVPLDDSFSVVDVRDGANVCALRALDGTLDCWTRRGEREHSVFDAPDGVDLATASTAGSRACAITATGGLQCWGDWHQPRRPAPDDVAFASVSLGQSASCGVTADTGAVRCWGELVIPEGQFTLLASGARHACGVRAGAGTVECWGDDAYNQATPPAGVVFAAFSASADHTCGIRAEDGVALCWGEDSYDGSRLRPPATVGFDAIGTGDDHACGLRKDDHTVECWGEDSSEPIQPPAGVVFSAISAGGSRFCGVRADDQRIQCWGPVYSEPVILETDAAFSSIGVSYGVTCGIRADATVECLGGDGASPPDGIAFASLSVGSNRSCGLTTAGTARCWGLGLEGNVPPEDLRLRVVSVGDDFTCGIRAEDDALECWGTLVDSRPLTPLAEAGFETAAVDATSGCAIRSADRTLRCWGTAVTVTGELASIRVGGSHACGLRPDGTASCWGTGSREELTPPEGVVFDSIDAGSGINCGIRTDDGTTQCWGSNDDREREPPPGVLFSSLDAGGAYTCGIDAESGLVSCWGHSSIGGGELDPPTGVSFRQVSAGGSLTCGLRSSDGKAQCWGGDSNYEGSMPPDTPFDAISSAGSYGCALRAEGDVDCWGAAERVALLSPPPGATFRSISAGLYTACGILDSNSLVQCWGDPDAASPPSTPFSSISAGGSARCGLRAEDSVVECWGGPFAPASTAFESISLASLTDGVMQGSSAGCGVRADDGSVSCWGDGVFARTGPPEGMRFASVSASNTHACGVHSETGFVHCWGDAVAYDVFDAIDDDVYGEIPDAISSALQPPSEVPFTSVAVGEGVSCGVRAVDGKVACWGTFAMNGG